MAISLKSGVSIVGIKPEMVMATVIIEGVMNEFGVATVVTSGDDSEHGESSLHFDGKALDFRTRDLLPDQQVQMTETVRTRLGVEFDVVLEDDHLHVEFDPPEPEVLTA